MIIELFLLFWNFMSDMYHAGGASLRWVIWGWAAFLCLYFVLSRYDKIQRKEIIDKRTKKKTNYYYTLHLFGVLAASLTYGNLLSGWPIFIPIATSKITIQIWSVVGFLMLAIGLTFVMLARLYLNGFWGKDIYTYDTSEYTLVKQNVYGKCRHPIYFGQTCMVIGTSLVINNYIVLGLAILLFVMNLFRARTEDKHLKELFGAEWEQYKDQVSFFFPL